MKPNLRPKSIIKKQALVRSIDDIISNILTFCLPPGLPVQLETLKTDLATRDNEIVGLKMKVDTLTNQQSEHQHYIDVLKDQIRSKEQQSSMFNADVS